MPGGGLANSTRINNGQSQMGWGIDTFSASAVKGEEPYTAKHDKLRCLGTGYSPTEHLLLRHTGAGPTDMRAILTQRGCKDRRAAAFLDRRDDVSASCASSAPARTRSAPMAGAISTAPTPISARPTTTGRRIYVYVALGEAAALMTEIAQGRRGGRLVAFPDDVRKHMIDQQTHAEGTLEKSDDPGAARRCHPGDDDGQRRAGE